MNIIPITATGLYPLIFGDEAVISACVVQVEGLTGSMTPTLRVTLDGQSGTPPTPQNCAYTNLATGEAIGAGAPITADGLYEFTTDGSVVIMDVTSLTGTCKLFVKSLLGAASGGGGSSGGGGAVTVADGADVALGTTTDTAVGDANGTLVAHARMSAKAAAQGAADNSTNSTFKAPVLAATATAAAPTLTEGHQAPLSIDLAGTLRTSSTFSGALPAGTNTIGKAEVVDAGGNIQPAGDTAARGIYGAITDLTNTAAVKAASTAAGATDPALVVSVSPNSPAKVQGNVAAGAAASGANPILLGSVNASSNLVVLSTVTPASVTPTLSGIEALVTFGVMTAFDGSGWRRLNTASNSSDGTGGTNDLSVAPRLYNGSNYDHQRNNMDVALLASASRTTTQTSADIVNYNGKGIVVTLDMTVVTASPSVTVTINGKDPASGKYSLILGGAAIVTISTNTYKIYPGLPATANVSVNDILPRTFQIVVTANTANAGTYSLGYSLIL